MPIGRRLYVQFLVAILPLALLVVWLALSRNDLPQRVNAALKAYDLSLESANAFRDFMGGVADALDTGRLGSGAVASLKRSHESARQLAAVSPEDALLPGRVAAIVAPLAANPSIDTILPLKDEAQALRVALLSASEAKRAALTRLVEEEEANARRKRDLIYVAALGALLLIGFTAFILRRVVRGITTPLAQTVAVAHAIAEGRLDTPIDVRGNDELAHLQVAMKAMQDNLCVIVRAVRSAAESVADASQLVSVETQDLSQRSEEQAASLEEAAASMEQLSTAVRENSANAVEAEKLARGVAGAAVGGGDSVKRVVETMRGITDSSRRIGDIVGVIDSIAFQTNILALNAAVEAARAGDQGRGFAVVAAEVRSLAQRSATAATEIKSLIAESVTRIDGGGREVEVAGGAIDALVSDVKKVSALMSEIAAASTQQEQGIRQVSTSVTDMDRVVQQNAVAVHRSAAQGEKLKRDAHHLEDAVSRFKLPGEAHPSAMIPAPSSAPTRKRLGSA